MTTYPRASALYDAADVVWGRCRVAIARGRKRRQCLREATSDDLLYCYQHDPSFVAAIRPSRGELVRLRRRCAEAAVAILDNPLGDEVRALILAVPLDGKKR